MSDPLKPFADIVNMVAAKDWKIKRLRAALAQLALGDHPALPRSFAAEMLGHPTTSECWKMIKAAEAVTLPGKEGGDEC